VICASIAGYFGYNVEKERRAITQLEARIASLNTRLAEIRVTKSALEAKVTLLRPASIDPDMLDERARAAVNAVRKNDIVIYRTHP